MKRLQEKLVVWCLVFAMIVAMGNNIAPLARAAEDYTTSAVELPLNGSWGSDHYITDTNTEDYYRITVPSDGKLTIKIMVYTKYLYYDLYNTDLSTNFDEHEYYYGTESSPSTESYTYIFSAGTYYLKVSKSYTGRYKLYAEFESFGANDAGANSYDSPMSLPMNTTITGALTRTDKEDWYRLQIPSDGNYAVQFVAYMKYVDYYVYNSDLSKEIDSHEYYYGTELTPATANYNYTLSAGVHYIKIAKGDSGKYLLTWSALSKENCTHEYETSTVDATYTSEGYTVHTCKICGNIYKDGYTSKLKLGKGSLGSIYGGRRKLHVYYYSVNGADGYQFRWSSRRSLSGAKKKTIHRSYSGSIYIKGLKKNKRYYVQVRAYKNVGGQKLYGKWSSRKSGRTSR